MNDEQPAMVPMKIVSDFLESKRKFRRLCSFAMLRKVRKVLVLEGAFKDYIASFEALDDKQRVQLLLSFLGRETRISLPNYAVEAA